MGSFDQTTALITGGGSGIGRETALEAANEVVFSEPETAAFAVCEEPLERDT
ncbi:hypothetical protein [Haloterrigena gelatinilytica]|uniref:hypothetical protein n=1 Tax=Haloterrigena gelatinilytica TaxID=2741724 RepID=UPI0020C723C4|nr:hypothetical protein [Haloterrigena gelatinilytica]